MFNSCTSSCGPEHTCNELKQWTTCLLSWKSLYKTLRTWENAELLLPITVWRCKQLQELVWTLGMATRDMCCSKSMLGTLFWVIYIYIFIHSVDVLSKRFWTGAIRSYISVSLWWEEPYIFVPDSFTYHTVMVTSRQLSRRFDKLGDGDGLRCLCPFWRLGCFLSQYPLTHLNEHLWQCAPTCSWTSKNV